MSADQPLTGDELATIKARAEFCDMEWDRDAGWTCRVHIDDATNDTRCRTFLTFMIEDVPRLVAEIERLQRDAVAWKQLALEWEQIARREWGEDDDEPPTHTLTLTPMEPTE